MSTGHRIMAHVNADREIHAPAAWERLPLERMSGTVMLIGGTDTGKSTLAKWLAARFLKTGRKRVALLDGDMGQSTLGLPGTMNMKVLSASCRERRPIGFFVGNTSPRAYMLPVLTGAHRLLCQARKSEAEIILVDTTGLVTGSAGGNLKHWKIQLLEPDWILFLQRENELDHILAPVRKDTRYAIQVLPVSPSVRKRSPEERSERRRTAFRKYFSKAGSCSLSWKSLPVYGTPHPPAHTLIALQDNEGLLLSLGVFLSEQAGRWDYLAPDHDPERVRSLRVGALKVDPATGVQEGL